MNRKISIIIILISMMLGFGLLETYGEYIGNDILQNTGITKTGSDNTTTGMGMTFFFNGTTQYGITNVRKHSDVVATRAVIAYRANQTVISTASFVGNDANFTTNPLSPNDMITVYADSNGATYTRVFDESNNVPIVNSIITWKAGWDGSVDRITNPLYNIASISIKN